MVLVWNVTSKGKGRAAAAGCIPRAENSGLKARVGRTERPY